MGRVYSDCYSEDVPISTHVDESKPLRLELAVLVCASDTFTASREDSFCIIIIIINLSVIS
jgi:hypothetical protein